MKVYIVSELLGKVGIPNVVGVFTTLELAKEAVTRVARSRGIKEEDIDNFIDENYDIEKWFVDTACLRGE